MLEKEYYESIKIFISDSQKQDSEKCINIKEKTPSSCYSQFMANLLLLQNPDQKILTVYASKGQNKSQLESTLKNMNFQNYTVHLH